MTMRVIGLAVVLALLAPAGASASCLRQTAAEQRARAQIIVEGEILPATAAGQARVRVGRYIKGSGPAELRLVGVGGDGVVTSIDITPGAGERWRLLGRLNADGALLTTACDGSSPLAATDPRAASDDLAATGAPTATVTARGSDDAASAWWVALVAVAAAGALGGAITWQRTRRRSHAPAEPDESSAASATGD